MKKSGIVRKIAALLLTATVAAGASAMSANATTKNMDVYQFQPTSGWFGWKTTYYSASDMNWLQNLYDGNYNGHAARGGTHYNAGSMKGRCQCTVKYLNSRGKIAAKASGYTGQKTGWSETPWVTVTPSDTIVKIVGVGQKFSSRSAYTPFVQDTLNTYARGYANK